MAAFLPHAHSVAQYQMMCGLPQTESFLLHLAGVSCGSLTSYNRGCKTQLHLSRCLLLQNIPGLLQPYNLLFYYLWVEDSRRLVEATGKVTLARRGGVHTAIPRSVLW